MKSSSALREHIERTIGNAGFADFFMSLVRAENAISARADTLMPTGVTVARWQVMKMLARFSEPATVPALARALSLSRQAVQKQVDFLLAQKFVELRENPAHRRSPLVALTRDGHLACEAATKRWFWVARALGETLDAKSMERIRQQLDAISERLASELGEADEPRAAKASKGS